MSWIFESCFPVPNTRSSTITGFEAITLKVSSWLAYALMWSSRSGDLPHLHFSLSGDQLDRIGWNLKFMLWGWWRETLNEFWYWLTSCSFMKSSEQFITPSKEDIFSSLSKEWSKEMPGYWDSLLQSGLVGSRAKLKLTPWRQRWERSGEQALAAQDADILWDSAG